ncbi:MAG: hypothetical protein DMG89_06175 [Acidobacteria bacterium]|nr:MAG: hypothetical protein DMG89_06175 [Acidobacteriota bacterium]
MRFSTEVASSGSIRGFQIPLEHSEFRVAVFNDKPVIWVIGDSSADFASELLKSSHAVHLAS